MAGDSPKSPPAAAEPQPTAATSSTTTTDAEGVHVTQTGTIAPAAQPEPEGEAQAQAQAGAQNQHPPEEDDDEDADSVWSSEAASSTASISASIMEYRTLQGRTYHSDRHETDYFTPNDEQQLESCDITHHYMTILLDGKLYLPPLADDVQDILDVGTGTGIWAIDMADKFPGATIIGTDLSPTQPSWVPPNVKFEIDDCTLPWLYNEDKFDFIYMRLLTGGIASWDSLMSEAARCCRPGGYIQSCEMDYKFECDDGSLPEDSLISTFFNPTFIKLGEKIGRPFTVVRDRLQTKAMQAAGLTDIQEFNFKVPMGGWPQDKKLAEVGELTKITLLNDIEGYTLAPYKTLMGDKFNHQEFQVMLANLRREVRKCEKFHGYMNTRFVYGRKPLT